MKSINSFKLGIIALTIILLPACTKDFEEENYDPNAITSVTPDLLLPGILRSSVSQMVSEGWGTGNLVVQHTAKYQFVDEDRYLWGNKSGLWNSMYSTLRDVNVLIDLSETSNQPEYKGIALIMKSWMFSILTDAYGDVPYTEATKALEGIFTPKYDPQEQIYEGILQDLEEANALLATSNGVPRGDLIYQGNLLKWRKLANSLKLRYLMRISDRKDVKTAMQAILDDPSTYPVFENNTDDGVYTYYAAAPNQFPNYTMRIGSFDEVRLSQKMESTLEAFNDPRITVFARPTSASANTSTPVYTGMPNGLSDTEALNYNGGSNNISRIGQLYFEGSITPEGLQVAKGYIMAYPELQFILAEAASKNLISTGKTAQQYYEDGIRGSFIYFNEPMPAGYLTRIGVAFNEATALKQIGTQKWIALFFSGLEAWFDWRRTGEPTIIPGPDNQNNNRVPVRYKYPLNEQSQNAENLQAAIQRQGPDDINTKVWWDKQ